MNVKIVDITTYSTGFVVPDDHELLTVFPHWDDGGGSCLKAVIAEKPKPARKAPAKKTSGTNSSKS